jgi:superfamily II DNA or RNA helicase
MEKKIKKENMPEEMLREYMISKGVDKAKDKWVAFDNARKEYKGKYVILYRKYIKKTYGKTVNEILGVSKKPNMPEEMLREYMISKGVDKAKNKWIAWKKARKEYNGEYIIPVNSYLEVIYGKTLNEILCISKFSYMPEEMLREYMISKGVDKASNKKIAWKKARKEYCGEYIIPVNSYLEVIYGKTINEILCTKLIMMPEEMLREYMISKGVDKAKDKRIAWDKAKKEYCGKYIIITDHLVKKTYGKTVNEILGVSKKPYMPEEMLREYMISKGVDKAKDKQLAWNKARKEYNGEYNITHPGNIKDIYGKTLYEFFDRLGYNPKTRAINFLTLHINDLAFMDKTQLIHITLLDNLPKDDYKKIIDCPKGEARKGVIKSMVDGLKNSEEGTETFEEFLEEETEKQNTDAKEETELEKSLHTGIDITEKPGLFDQKKSIEDVFMEIESLDNLYQGGYIEQEAIDYITCSEIQKLWNAAIYNPGNAMKLVEEYASTKGSSKFFNAIIREFLKQYKEVCDMKLPEGYSFPYQPLLMQKLTAYMVKERSQFANWSETGTGKTLSGVLASRCIDSRLTLVIAVNSTVNNWTENAIRVAYPDSKVYQKKDISDSTVLDRDFHNYVVVNYEEFQNSSKFLNKWKPFVENNTVDFVILDEIQKVKSKGSDSVSKRRVVIENLLQTIDIKHGRDLEKEGRMVPVLALSATPVINTLNEGLSILSLLKGTDFISRRRTTRRFALDCHFEMVKTGLRLVEESPARERLITFPIKRSNKDILEINKTNGNLLVNIAVSNCLLKLGECIRNGYLQTGTPTLVYTELVTDVIDNAMLYLQGYGFKVGEFTGRNESTREKVLEDFIAGKYDVLLASKPITTGVDGLQNVCNRIIPIDLPWTYAEYHQLTGRCNRKGTKFDEVTIIIPTVEYINDDGEIWSLDNSKLARIKYKQTLADVIMTGEIPDDIITKEEAFRLAKERLLEFINSNKKDQEVTREIPVQATEIKEIEEPKTRIRGDRDQRDYFSEFQGLNQRISTSTCEGVFSKIITNESDWREYHNLRDLAMGEMQNQPINTVARDFLRSTKHKVLGDMGCGMNKLKTLLPNNYEVISVDMYAADETVKVCNIMDTSSIISDNSLDIAVYCLSLWSRNWRDILKDAYRILDYDGKLIIVEPISSLSKSIDRVRETLIENRFNNISVVKDSEEKFYYMTATK